MPDLTDPRIGRARLLRRQGKTYAEIRALIGPVGKDMMAAWFRGIPRPPETHRSRPHAAVRDECRRLRAQGFTYGEIAEMTGASKGSISPWVRDIRPPRRSKERHAQHLQRLRGKGAKAQHDQAEEARLRRVLCAREQVGRISARELLLLGAGQD